MTVRSILDTKGHEIQSVEPDVKLSAAIKILGERKIGAVLVMNQGHIEGILSERDIIRALASRGATALEEPVSRSMTEKVVTCTCQSAINEVMEMMTQGKFRHVPVVEGGRLVGIVSIGDIVKHRLAEVEAETRAMRDYIATA